MRTVGTYKHSDSSLASRVSIKIRRNSVSVETIGRNILVCPFHSCSNSYCVYTRNVYTVSTYNEAVYTVECSPIDTNLWNYETDSSLQCPFLCRRNSQCLYRIGSGSVSCFGNGNAIDGNLVFVGGCRVIVETDIDISCSIGNNIGSAYLPLSFGFRELWREGF